MLEESPEDILDRVENFALLDLAACKILSTACLMIPDERSAHELLSLLREHMIDQTEVDKLYDIDFYLGYVREVLDLLGGLSSNPMTDELERKIRDTYEVFLYNRSVLGGVLNSASKAARDDAMRDNYWMN